MDGESIPGPWRCKKVHAECLEFPASWNRNSAAALLAQANVLEANIYMTDNYSLSDIYIGIVKCKAELLQK